MTVREYKTKLYGSKSCQLSRSKKVLGCTLSSGNSVRIRNNPHFRVCPRLGREHKSEACPYANMEHILGEERVFGGRRSLRYFSGTLFLLCRVS